MPSPRTSRAHLGIAYAMALLLACNGCEERSPTHTADASDLPNENVPDASTHLGQVESAPTMPLELDEDGGMEVLDLIGPAINMPSETHLLPLAGKIDIANRYLSAVLVTVEFSEEKEEVCSGALIGRRLVLTAGHCVCQRRQSPSEQEGPQGIIDASSCAETATVHTKIYGPFDDTEEKIAWRRQNHPGVVRPHPELRILLDMQGQVVSSHADLAVITLDEPVESKFRPLPLANKDLQLQESIVIVGSGYDELAHAYDGERRFSTNKVIEVLPSGSGRMRIQQPGGHHYRGDSGGPCLRVSSEGAVLVGISSRSLGEGEAVTSIYGYRDWLHGELQRAEGKRPRPPR